MALVPIARDVTFYAETQKQQQRYQHLELQFSKEFGVAPAFYARAPGRVNLIGEHIDYCHFSVLPMAIEADVVAAVAPHLHNTIVIANTDPAFKTETIELPDPCDAPISIDKTHPLWVDYFKCALVVARKHMLETGDGNLKQGKLQGFIALFDGNVPTGGGLSSSAAFCIAATLAVLRANGVKSISKAKLTEITVVSEHYVGLSNGGMDQSASINGEAAKALLVSFKPALSAAPFSFPRTEPEFVFLITNSLVTANKTETAPTNYNLRVVEVAVAAEIIRKHFDLDVCSDSNIETATLRGVFDAYFTQTLGEAPWDGQDIDVGIARLEKMLAVVESLYSADASLDKDGISTETAAGAIGTTLDEFNARFLSHFPVRFSKLNVYRRTRHVYSDSLRVLQTLRLARDYTGDSVGFLRQLGELMDASQALTRDFNHASTPECDSLCSLARANGSLGSRVTGAGFGGCVVHLTTVDALPRLVETLKRDYYGQRFPGMSEAALDDAIVVSKPAAGACIVEF